MSAIRTEHALKCIYHKELFFFILVKPTSRNSVITDVNLRRHRSERQDATRANCGKAFPYFQLVENYMNQLFLANHLNPSTKVTFLSILYGKMLFLVSGFLRN